MQPGQTARDFRPRHAAWGCAPRSGDLGDDPATVGSRRRKGCTIGPSRPGATARQRLEELLDLPAWLRSVDPESADAVLHRLAEPDSPTGGDDVTATGALAWLLLPAACLVAHRLRSLTTRIDEVVAAQLWLEVRTFPWQRQLTNDRGAERHLAELP